MIFIVTNSNRERLTELTKLLLSVFPGSTVYQHLDPKRISKDVLNNKVDGVFLEAGLDNSKGLDFIWRLRKRKADVPVFVLSESEDFRTAAAKAGADGYFVYPLMEDALKNVLLSKQ